MNKKVDLYSLDEFEAGWVYKHIENNKHYRVYKGKLQCFSLGCWNEEKEPIYTKKQFSLSEDFNEEGMYQGEGVTAAEKEPEQNEGLKILDFSKEK